MTMDGIELTSNTMRPPDHLRKRRRNFAFGFMLILMIDSAVLNISSTRSFFFQSSSDSKQTRRPREKVEEYFQVTSHSKIKSLINRDTILQWKTKGSELVLPYFSRRGGNERRRSSSQFQVRSLRKAAKDFKETGRNDSHILIADLNENWGAFSTQVPDRTIGWGILEKHWAAEGLSVNDTFAYIDHPSTLAVITIQHHAYDHPKVHSIPLGIKNFKAILKAIRKPRLNRTQLLMINDSGWRHRANITAMVQKRFPNTKNTYSTHHTSATKYYDQLRSSKFILSPSGLGWDCYRHWEALYLGCIPVIEHYNRADGWHRTFQDLPVLWVDNYANLTPELLHEAYPQIAAKADSYIYEKLTIPWWVDFITSFLHKEE